MTVSFRWNSFRTFCASEKKLKLALEITDDLPDEKEIDRWLGEPIGCAIIKTKTFVTNAHGYPVLSIAHRKLIYRLLSHQILIVVSGAAREDVRPLYQQYINRLWQVSK